MLGEKIQEECRAFFLSQQPVVLFDWILKRFQDFKKCSIAPAILQLTEEKKGSVWRIA